ncbi:MAG TPA: GlsB/YeaQ/YmgE family stress response membrane protein [Sphingobium sp.]|nr:GlsB/YeaQ/YmgE family stress response membrane protein [Sphingobium sp.]
MLFVLRLIVVGLLIGWAARFLYPGAVEMGWIGSILLGLAGSLLGGFLAQMFSRHRAGQPLEPAGCLGSVLGAMLLIFVGRALDLF